MNYLKDTILLLGISTAWYYALRFKLRISYLTNRSKALEALYDVGRVMTSTLDFHVLLQQIMKLSMETIGSETASVMLEDTESGELVLVCSLGLPKDATPGTRYPRNHGIGGWVLCHAEPVILRGDPAQDERFRLQETSRGHITSSLSVPLMGKTKPVGVLNLNNKAVGVYFTQEDLDLLTSIGAQAGIAVENARLHLKMEESNHRLTRTVEHLRNLKSSLTSMTALNLMESLDTMLDAAIEGTGSVAGSLNVLDQGDSIYSIEACYESQGLNFKVDENDTEKNPTSEKTDKNEISSNQIMMRVLTAEGNVLGLLKLKASPERGGFNEDDNEFVNALVEHASAVIMNNYLYQQAEDGRKKLQATYEDLRRKQEELVESEKMAVIGRFSAWICHEINNPLGAISGCAQMMQRKLNRETAALSNSPSYDRYLGTIVSETERCARITGDLLQFARQRDPHFVETDLSELLIQVSHLIHYKTNQPLNIHLEMDPSVPLIFADPQRLTQVFLNLLTNAQQAMPDGGSIEVRTKLLSSLKQDDDFVEISIRDHGCGISTENSDQIFHPFFTTKNGGTGLGLTISKSIIEKHHGELRLENSDEGGAQAIVNLPVSQKIVALSED